MIIDLNSASPSNRREADVAIVGGGLAGLVMAERLSRRGARVVVLESGGATQENDSHPLNQVEMAAQSYSGAEHGRYRCLGGTSSRWGGAMLPFLKEDLEDHTAGWGNAWGVAYSELMQHVPELEKIFELDPEPYDLEAGSRLFGETTSRFMLRSPKWPQFSARNVANVFHYELRRRDRLLVWLNATVVNFRFDGERCTGLRAQSLSGNWLDVSASNIVITAGAIESTRLLLLINQATAGRISGLALGRYFHDHLSAPIANIVPRDGGSLNKTFAFRFVTKGMRNVRLELNGKTRRDNHLPGAFAHVSFAERREGGFAAVRRLYQAVQRRIAPSPADIKLLALSAPWLLKAAYWRYVNHKVLAAEDAFWQLHLVTEQEPIASNRVYLSQSRVDEFGLPLAVIDWRVSQSDVARFEQVASFAKEEWGVRGFNLLGEYAPRDPADVEVDLYAGGGIYHPAGSTRIGNTHIDGVVNSRLQPFGAAGLHVVSTSVFPNCGGANPSMMLLLFALRASDDLERELKL